MRNKPLPRTSLVKIPRQQRSVDMVHAILDGGIAVLQREGVVAFNTNRVAEVAGVSVGSLYQYFANREMLISGIVERGVIDAEVLVRAAVSSAGERPMDEVLRSLLTALLASLEPYRDLLYEVLSATPVLSATGVAAVLETRLSDALTDFLVGNAHRYRLRGGAAGRYVMVNSAIYVVLKWLAERPAISREALVEVFVAQFAGAGTDPG